MKKCWNCGKNYTYHAWQKVYKTSNICPDCSDVLLMSNSREILKALKGLYEHTKNNHVIHGLKLDSLIVAAKGAIEKAEGKQ